MKSSIRTVLATLGYRIEGIRYTPRQLLDRSCIRQLQFDDIVCRHMFDHGEQCVFVQVGAYDGESTDPLRKYIDRCGWSGVMLEPQPAPAARLRELYRDRAGVVVMQAALDRERGARPLFVIDSDTVPAWVGGMASFDRGHLLKHEYLVPGIAALVRELSVETVTFDDVLERIPGPRLDLLQVDAEGADALILSLFPFDRIKPAIVQWEIKNLSREQQEIAIDRLLGHGYRVARANDEDMVAVLGREAK